MVQFVIKRDGKKEPFDSNKLNRWAEWASESCDVSWSDVLLTAVKTLPDEVKTSDIHATLIKTCIEFKDRGHVKMAARLLLGQIYKEAFGDFSIPSLKDFYYYMVGNGHWDFMGYTDEDLVELDKVIDHTLDFTYEYATLRQFYDKYSVSVSGACLESPQMMMMGLAMSNHRYGTLDDVIEAYANISALKINLPTPTLNGERTTMKGSPSCVVITGGDTVQSIGAATHVAYEMTANRAGIGIEYATRSINDPVKGGRVEHTGKFPLYSYVDRAVKSMTQISRGGSATVTFTCLDPEVEMLLRLKSQRVDIRSRLDQLDYSFSVNNLFLQKVAKNEEWMLVSQYHAPELWEAFYSPDTDLFEREYEKALNNPSVKKTLVAARDIINLFLSMRNDSGRMYLSFINNMNQHTPFKDPIRLSNLCCVSGDTEVEVRVDGAEVETELTIDELHNLIEDETEVLIKSYDVRGEEVQWQRVTASMITGYNRDVIDLVDPEGEVVLTCTPDHEIYTKSSGWVEAEDILPEDILLSSPTLEIDAEEVSGYVTQNAGTTMVYDITVEENHNFFANGILVHNCEIMLPTAPITSVETLYTEDENTGEIALCFLASLVVSRLNTVEEYMDAAYVTAKIIDNTIDETAFPYKHMKMTTMARRSIGVGMTDVAHWMAKQGVKYDTVEGRNAVHRLAELHSYALHTASVRLAKERGACEWFDRTKYANERPWLPIDSYKKAVDEHHTQELMCDWESLREDIKKYGMRFSVVESFMPVESSSVFSGSVNGLYPIRNPQIYKKSKKGVVFFEAPDYENLKDQYQNAYDVDHLDLVKFYSIVQKFTGQGISADFYTDLRGGKKQSMKDLYQRLFLSAKLGMKTWYYENFQTVSDDEVLVEPEEEDEEGCESCTL